MTRVKEVPRATLHVLVDIVCVGEPEYLSQRTMPAGEAEALNEAYKAQEIRHRWERCGEA